jgi:hypothetical protein
MTRKTVYPKYPERRLRIYHRSLRSLRRVLSWLRRSIDMRRLIVLEWNRSARSNKKRSVELSKEGSGPIVRITSPS